MRKIIAGKVYDTTTATELGSDYRGSSSDFNHWEETLYRSPKGTYFVHGKGGAASQWAERETYGNGHIGGQDIRVLTESEALAWGEAHLTVAEYESAFGTAEEG